MNVRIINKDDYSIIAKWWEHYDWKPVHPYLLSNSGFLVSDDNKNGIVAGWYVKTNGLTALVEWIIKNPSSKPQKFIKALSFLCKTIEEIAKKDGYKMIITFLENDKLKKFMIRRNYVQGDIGLTTYVKSL